MKYPNQIRQRRQIDALTGIKSSLDQIRSVISLIYLQLKDILFTYYFGICIFHYMYMQYHLIKKVYYLRYLRQYQLL